MGEKAYDKLSPDDLLLDMEDKFWDGKIKSTFDFICLLEEHQNHRAKIKVQRDSVVFEKCLNTQIAKAEAKLIK